VGGREEMRKYCLRFVRELRMTKEANVQLIKLKIGWGVFQMDVG